MTFAIPLVFFFVSSSIFSIIKTSGKIRALADAEKTGTRDFWQVMANGGVPAIITIVYFVTGNIIWFFPYVAGLCEASADTWATELGTLYPDSPVSIVSFKGVDPGQSGGVSILGTLSAIGGTLTTMLAASAGGYFIADLTLSNVKMWLIIANCGLAGALLDSVLGASVQAQYRCRKCHHWTERRVHCGQDATLVGGLRFVNNDLVNIFCTSFASLMAAIIFLFVI
jgi:uncharacterized protein (TIGR00297 family)